MDMTLGAARTMISPTGEDVLGSGSMVSPIGPRVAPLPSGAKAKKKINEPGASLHNPRRRMTYGGTDICYRKEKTVMIDRQRVKP